MPMRRAKATWENDLLQLIDEKGKDEKILAVAEHDPHHQQLQEVTDVGRWMVGMTREEKWRRLCRELLWYWRSW